MKRVVSLLVLFELSERFRMRFVTSFAVHGGHSTDDLCAVGIVAIIRYYYALMPCPSTVVNFSY